MKLENLKGLPSLAAWFNTVETQENTSDAELENAFMVSRNFNTDGLYFKVYRKVTLFKTASKIVVKIKVADTVDNRIKLRQKREILEGNI